MINFLSKKSFLLIIELFALSSFVYPNTEKLEIKSSQLLMNLELNDKAGAWLTSLKTVPSSENFQIAEKQPLFEIVFHSETDKGETFYKINSCNNWQEVKVEKKGNIYELLFHNNNSIPNAEELTIRVNLSTLIKNSSLWYESSAIHVSWGECTFSKNISLEKATLLPLSFINLPVQTKAFFPYSSGIVCNPVNEKNDLNVRYPTGFGASMPWYTIWSTNNNGLYIGAHDKNATVKDLHFKTDSIGGLSFDFTYPAINQRTSYSSFAPCDIVLTNFTGDWYDAAMLYKEWVKNEASWYPRYLLGPNGRKDTPQWMKELCVWVKGSDNQVEQFQEAVGVPVGFHWYSWHAIPFDNDYPHYFPAKKDFASRVKELQNHNVYVMPYINGRLWDSHDSGTIDSLFTKQALSAVTKQPNGEPVLESYGSKEANGSDVMLGVMCPSTELWKNKLKTIVLRLTEPNGALPGTESYGVNGVYIDQIAAARAVECFDKKHSHPSGGGDWWTLSYRDLLNDIHRNKPAGTILTTESNADGYVDGFDGFLVWQFQHNNQVPAFAAVYGGAIQLFGRNYAEDEGSTFANKMKLAQSFVFGEQLGWIGTFVLQNDDMMDFIKKLVQLRYKFREYFYKGEMGRSPLLIGKNPVHKVQWPFIGELHDVSNPSVQCGAWKIPSQKKAILMFSNYSDDKVKLNVQYSLEDWNITSKEYKVFRHNSDGTVKELKSLPEKLFFDPSDAFIIELQVK